MQGLRLQGAAESAEEQMRTSYVTNTLDCDVRVLGSQAG